MRVTLIGPGAIGGTVAAALALGGKHALTICANQPFGTLSITRAKSGDTSSMEANVVTSPAAAGPADWVLLCVKSHQTADAASWLKATVGPDAKLAVLQNGIEHRERVAPFIPQGAAVVPVVVQLPAERTAPGHVTLYGETALVVGDDEPAREFAALFTGTFMSVSNDPGFHTRQWEKLCLNAPGGAICALTNHPSPFSEVPALRDLARAVIEECMAVGCADGAVFAPDFADRLMGHFSRPGGRGNSMYYDRRDGRRLEWDARNAVILRRGAAHGIPTPIAATLVPLLQALDPRP